MSIRLVSLIVVLSLSLFIGSFSTSTHAQEDKVFLDLKEKNEVAWNATIGAWITIGSKPNIIIAANDLSVSDKFYALGKNVTIAAKSIEFKPSGFISSGFPQKAADGTGDGERGASGKPAGNLTLVIKKITSLRVSASGQGGGSGQTGASGASGPRSTVPSGNGEDAQCLNRRGSGGRDGADSTVASGNGVLPLTGGYKGGNAGAGGDGGSIQIYYLESAIDLSKIANQASWLGGTAGTAGSGGIGQYGNPGPIGSRGQDKTCDCHCNTCPPKSEWCEHGCETCDFKGGKPGPRGNYSGRAASGQPGSPASAGRLGSFTPTNLSDNELYTRLLEFLPDPARSKLIEAELRFAANYRTEAEKLLSEVLVQSENHEITQRAAVLQHRLQCGRNYYNRELNWAPIYFVGDPSGASIPRSLDWVQEELKALGDILKASEAVIRYRQQSVYNAEQAVNAYNLQLGQVSERMLEDDTAIKGFNGDITHLKEETEHLINYSRELHSRIDELQKSFANFPDLAGRVGQVTGNMTSAISSFGIAAASYHSGQYLLAIAELGNGFKFLGEAGNATNELLERMQRESLEEQLKKYVADIKDKLEGVRSQAQENIHGINRAVSNRDFASDRLPRLKKLQDELNQLKDAQDVISLKRLRDLAEEIHKEQRLHIGARVDEYRRYADLIMIQNNAQLPIEAPAGGLQSLYDSAHVDRLRLNEKQRYDNFSTTLPQVTIVSVAIKRSDEIIPDVFKTLDDAFVGALNDKKYFVLKVPVSIIKEKHAILLNARIRKIAIKLVDQNGHSEISQALLRHTGTTTPYLNDSGYGYSLNRKTQIMDMQSLGFQISQFWFRRLNDTWQIKFDSSPSRKIEEIVFNLEVELEVPPDSTDNAPKNILGMSMQANDGGDSGAINRCIKSNPAARSTQL